MSFDITVPNAGQSPGLFPSQNNTNFSRLKDLISGDHVFNDSVQADDGVHNQVTLVARATPTALPSGTNGILYGKLLGSKAYPFYYDGSNDFMMVPALAKAVFNGAGTIQGNAYNCTVAKSSTATFTLTFTNALPNTNVAFLASGWDSGFGTVIGRVKAITTASIRVQFVNDNGKELTTLTKGSIIIYGGV